MKIGNILDEIQALALVVPKFQREYLWSKEQAKQLMVSLFLEYPVGSLLVWKTDNPPEISLVRLSSTPSSYPAWLVREISAEF